MLGAITDGNGVVLYYAPLPGSSLIDAGSNALAVDADGIPLATDQIGNTRVFGDYVDIGAIEYPPGYPPTDISLSAGIVAENLPAGTIVGMLGTIDPTQNSTHTYTLVNGAHKMFNFGSYVVLNPFVPTRDGRWMIMCPLYPS